MSRPFDMLPLAQQAALLCQHPQFSAFLAALHSYPAAHDPAVFVRHHCAVSSRAELTTDAAAGRRFEALRTEYDAWRGKLAPPR